MIKLEHAKYLKYRQVIYHVTERNADGSPQRWRVNGKVKTWKRNANAVEVPLKYGLWGYGYLNENNLDQFCLTEEEARFRGTQLDLFSS